MKDNTFVIVGVSQTIAMLIIMAIVARTVTTILAFLGVIVLINAMCYVAHRMLNKK